MRRWMFFLCMWCARVSPGGVEAQEADAAAPENQEKNEDVRALAPQHLLMMSNTSGFIYNQIGLGHQLNVGYRWRLYDDPGSLWSKAHLGAMITTTVTPSYVRAGLRATVMPLSVLRLSAGYEYNYSFGFFSSVLSYPSATADHSDTALSERSDAGENYAGGRHHLYIEGLLQAKVGPVALRSKARFTFHSAALTEGDALFFRRGLDLLIPNDAWVVRSTTDLLYVPDWGLILGAEVDVAHAFYTDAHFEAGDDREAVNDTLVRLGPMVGWVFEDSGPTFREPTVVFIANWWLQHRYRTGVDTPQVLPFMLLAFRFKSDIFSSD